MNKTSAKTVQFKKWHCSISLHEYAANRKIKCIKLIDTEDGLPIATATVYLNGLQSDEIAIKNWAENEGIYEALLYANIIHPFHRIIPTGNAIALITRLAL